MNYNGIISIHSEENKIRQDIEKAVEKKKTELMSLDEYKFNKLEEIKIQLKKEENNKIIKLSKTVDNEIENINKETKIMLKKYADIEKSLLEKAKKLIKEELFSK